MPLERSGRNEESTFGAIFPFVKEKEEKNQWIATELPKSKQNSKKLSYCDVHL